MINEFEQRMKDAILTWQQARANACADGLSMDERTQRIKSLSLAEMELAMIKLAVENINE